MHSLTVRIELKLAVCSSTPDNVSPLYPKTKALDFTGHSYKYKRKDKAMLKMIRGPSF